MNQYIFRGKRKDGQGWVEGDLVRYWAYGVLYTGFGLGEVAEPKAK